MAEELGRTVLNGWHAKNGAKMVPFAGWEMPIQYKLGPLEEHHLVRKSAGLFDIGHMGRFEVSGGGALPFLESLVSSGLADLAENQSRYGLLCREDGGILDDLFVYRLPGRWLVVVNASNRAKDFAWLQAHAGSGVKLVDISEKLSMIALQGPKALEVLSRASRLPIEKMPERFFAAQVRVAGREVLAGRTGYTGEDGFELFPEASFAEDLWELLLAAGRDAGLAIGPIGLAARDSLRFEPAFSLYGHELTEEVTPVEAGLLWACTLGKDFVGAAAVRERKAAGPKEKLVTFEMVDKAVAREGYAVVDEAGAAAGRVASGMFAPTVNKFAGNAFVRPDLAATGKIFYIRIRDVNKKAVVVKRPLYVPAYRK